MGKTWWVRELIAQLRQAGKRVDCIAKTHAAVQNLACEAQTADHWVRKHVRAGGVHCDVLVVEELTQINVQLWADLAAVRLKGVIFIMAGDWGQFAPVCHHWVSNAVPEDLLEHSDMICELCDGNRVTLTKNMRSDEILFNYYTNLGTAYPRLWSEPRRSSRPPGARRLHADHEPPEARSDQPQGKPNGEAQNGPVH